jgi:NAD(P)-dependent dehydrogenase (short-subunit alcohol dehydrogenase family)
MSTPFHLTGKTILITGASSGIGSHAAKRITEMGGKVVLNGRDMERLNATKSSCAAGSATIIAADICTEEGRASLSKTCSQLDGLLNCAGTVHPFPVRFIDQKKMDQTMNINFEAPVLLTSLLLKEKKINPESSLVYISSVSSGRPQAGASMYGASKSAIEAFVKVLAQELSEKKIRVNCISPAMVKTPMYERSEALVSKEEMDAHIDKYLLGVGYPEDVANASIYLLSPASRWVTGINLILDGGLLL